MRVRKEELLVLCCFFVIAVTLIMPAHADIKSFKTDKTFYTKGDKIILSGTVEDKDVSNLVTVVIEDPTGNFVTLRQGFITFDKDFEVTIDTKEKFASHGIYNATGFIENKTNSKWITFDFSLDGSPVIHPTTQPTPTPQPIPTPQTQPTQTQQTSSTQQPNEEETVTNNEEKTIQEKIKERIEDAKKQQEAQANPPPKTESGSTTDQTTTGESIPTGETKAIDDKPTNGISTPIDLGSNLLYVIIGLGGAGATAGVVYGIKNKNRHDRDEKPVVKIREPSVKSTSEDDYALMILKNRLAKGEITIDEYNALRDALREP